MNAEGGGGGRGVKATEKYILVALACKVVQTGNPEHLNENNCHFMQVMPENGGLIFQVVCG